MDERLALFVMALRVAIIVYVLTVIESEALTVILTVFAPTDNGITGAPVNPFTVTVDVGLLRSG